MGGGGRCTARHPIGLFKDVCRRKMRHSYASKVERLELTTFSRCSPISSLGTVRPSIWRSDNGPEFTAKLVRRWLARLRVQTLYIAPGSPWGERLQRELQRQTERRVLERRDLLHTARGDGTRRAVEAAVQYRPTPSCPRRTTPRPRDDKTIALVPQEAPTPGTTDGSGSNIGSGTATGGTSHHHPPYRLTPEWNRQLLSPIRLHLEFLVLPHHLEEPVVGATGREKAVGGREAEGHLRGWRAHVGVDTEHG